MASAEGAAVDESRAHFLMFNSHAIFRGEKQKKAVGLAWVGGGRLTTILQSHQAWALLPPATPPRSGGTTIFVRELMQAALPVKRVSAVRLNGFQLCDWRPPLSPGGAV